MNVYMHLKLDTEDFWRIYIYMHFACNPIQSYSHVRGRVRLGANCTKQRCSAWVSLNVKEVWLLNSCSAFRIQFMCPHSLARMLCLFKIAEKNANNVCTLMCSVVCCLSGWLRCYQRVWGRSVCARSRSWCSSPRASRGWCGNASASPASAVRHNATGFWDTWALWVTPYSMQDRNKK